MSGSLLSPFLDTAPSEKEEPSQVRLAAPKALPLAYLRPDIDGLATEVAESFGVSRESLFKGIGTKTESAARHVLTYMSQHRWGFSHEELAQKIGYGNRHAVRYAIARVSRELAMGSRVGRIVEGMIGS